MYSLFLISGIVIMGFVCGLKLWNISRLGTVYNIIFTFLLFILGNIAFLGVFIGLAEVIQLYSLDSWYLPDVATGTRILQFGWFLSLMSFLLTLIEVVLWLHLIPELVEKQRKLRGTT